MQGFAIQSAGLRGKEAAEALEAATKGAAIGLGEARDIGLLSAAAMTAWGSETLSATRSTEILGAAVKAGNLEASELAGALGQALAPASTLGVSFEELAGSVAFYTRFGVSASEATTSVRGALTQMLKPSKQAQNVLAEIGMTTDDLQRMVGEQGLVATLQHLRNELGDDQEAFARVIGRAEALSFALAVTGDGAEDMAQIMEDMTDSVGSLDEAWKIQAETVGTRLKIAWEEAKVPLQELAADILPLIADLVGAAASAFLEFMELLGVYEREQPQKWWDEFAGSVNSAGVALQRYKDEGVLPASIAAQYMTSAIINNREHLVTEEGILESLSRTYSDHQNAVIDLAYALMQSAIEQGANVESGEAFLITAQNVIGVLHRTKDATDDTATAADTASTSFDGAADSAEDLGDAADAAKTPLETLYETLETEITNDPFAALNASLGKIPGAAATAQAELIATAAAIELATLAASNGGFVSAGLTSRIFGRAVETIQGLRSATAGSVQDIRDSILNAAGPLELSSGSGSGGGTTFERNPLGDGSGSGGGGGGSSDATFAEFYNLLPASIVNAGGQRATVDDRLSIAGSAQSKWNSRKRVNKNASKQTAVNDAVSEWKKRGGRSTPEESPEQIAQREELTRIRGLVDTGLSGYSEFDALARYDLSTRIQSDVDRRQRGGIAFDLPALVFKATSEAIRSLGPTGFEGDPDRSDELQEADVFDGAPKPGTIGGDLIDSVSNLHELPSGVEAMKNLKLINERGNESQRSYFQMMLDTMGRGRLHAGGDQNAARPNGPHREGHRAAERGRSAARQ